MFLEVKVPKNSLQSFTSKEVFFMRYELPKTALLKHFLWWAGLMRDVDRGTCCAIAMLIMYADSSGDSVYQVP